METYSEESPELQKLHMDGLIHRWAQLHALEKEWAEQGVKFLFLTNAGGAIATLGFLGGAPEQIVNDAGVKWSLLLFVFGLIFVAFVIARAYYRASAVFKAYRIGAVSFENDKISWDDLCANDDELAGPHWLDQFLPLTSFILFCAGCAVGGCSLFG